MKRIFWYLISILVVGSLAITACGGQPAAPAAQEQPAAPQAPATSNEEYIYVSAMGNLEFFNAHKYGWKWGGEALGVKTSYVGPAECDINAMVAAFDQAIAQKPKGIVVFAVDPGLTPSINKASEAGIPAVTILADLPESKRIAYVGSSQHDLGFVGGTKLAEALGGNGKVAI